MSISIKEINYYPSIAIPPHVDGDVQYVLSIKITDLCLEETIKSTNHTIQLKLWGSTTAIPIPISYDKATIGMNESTLLSVCCSLDQLNNYWRDSQYVYFEVIDFDALQIIGFGSIETSRFDPFKPCELVEEEVVLYSSETGFRVAQCKCSFTLLPYKAVNNQF